MIRRARDRFGLYPELLAADTAYGSADMLGWLVEDEGIEPHIPVVDKSERHDGAFPATEFAYDHVADEYACPGGKKLKPYWRDIAKARPEFGKDGFKKCFARKQDCAVCPLKPRCTPNQPTRKIARSAASSSGARFSRCTFSMVARRSLSSLPSPERSSTGMLASFAAHTQHMPVAQVADPHGVARPENLQFVLFRFYSTIARRSLRSSSDNSAPGL